MCFYKYGLLNCASTRRACQVRVSMSSSITGSGGNVTFDGLNPDRGLGYILLISGTLPDGTVITLEREFHVG